jgi:hypothetical protein
MEERRSNMAMMIEEEEGERDVDGSYSQGKCFQVDL